MPDTLALLLEVSQLGRNIITMLHKSRTRRTTSANTSSPSWKNSRTTPIHSDQMIRALKGAVDNDARSVIRWPRQLTGRLGCKN